MKLDAVLEAFARGLQQEGLQVQAGAGVWRVDDSTGKCILYVDQADPRFARAVDRLSLAELAAALLRG